jgi:hypothetical protein
MIHSLACWLGVVAVLGATIRVISDPANGKAAATPDDMAIMPAEPELKIEPAPRGSRDWSIQAGVAVISRSDIGEIFTGGLDRAVGEAGGEVYSLMLNWTAHRFEIPCRGRKLRPQFEPYVMLALVDEKDRSIFPDYNGGVGFRWVDFPWNKWVATSIFTGIGLSYSKYVYTIDRERHPGEDRSHLKFDWPIQLTFALPRWPQHQLVLFNDHQSGGHIFDGGGVNSFGIGYRFEF